MGGACMKTQIIYDEFFPAQEAIKSSCESLVATKPSDPKYSSISKALDAFTDRLRQFVKLKQQYEALLERDSASLLRAGLMFQLLDASIASDLTEVAEAFNGDSGVASIDSVDAAQYRVTGDNMSRAYKQAGGE